MKKILSFFLLALFWVSVSAQGTRLSVNPQQLRAGSVAHLSYDAKGGPLGGMDDVVGIAYTFENDIWKVYDVELRNVGNNVWEGTFPVSVNTAFVAFKFQHTLDVHPDATDNNDDSGYVYQVSDSKGKRMAGAVIADAVFKTPSATASSVYEGVRDYFSKGHVEPTGQELQAAIDAESKLNKKDPKRFFLEKCVLLIKIFGIDGAKPYLRELIGGLEKQKNLTENDLNNILSAYQFYLNDKDKANETKEEILRKYPYGGIARLEKLQIPYTITGEEYFSLARQLRKDFSISKYYENPDSKGYVYGNFYRRLARELFTAKRYDELGEVLKEMNSGMLEDAYIHQPKQAMKFPDIDPNDYYDISKRYIEVLAEKVDFVGNLSGTDVTPKQSAARRQMYLGFYRTVQTQLAYRTGHYQDGIDCMNAIPENMRFNYPSDGNESYVRCLEALDRKEDAVNAARAFAANGKTSPYILEILRNYFNDLTEKPAQNFEDYLYSLKTDEAKAEILENVKKGLVCDSYTPFDVEDFNGGRVNSDDFAEDDIVVLDFWAPWCAPCCAALVGMQMTVEKYIEDPKVKFYFVDTQDKSTPEIIHKYWNSKGYHDMLVVFDQNRDSYPNGHDKLYSDMFPGTSGIPKKAILKGGKIRYRAEGYMGSPGGLMDEISAVVELLKKE